MGEVGERDGDVRAQGRDARGVLVRGELAEAGGGAEGDVLVAVSVGGCDGWDAAGAEDGNALGGEGREGVEGAGGGGVGEDGGCFLLDDCVCQ